nr:uncharacterized protein LOC122268270 isoform X1 [Parasteatoda tepidariorum]XP_042903457.1 uncharacterized protein LOC122268270 isoform X2 [Parasteatoda tepidariorum]XP_042903458.1 uncharacterized protein LOC122268270 isoform X3 [Parasteatoda tepidariorum]
MFDKALKDAEKSIKLCPVWPKGYFRKGRALLGQKKYAAAEKFFVEVLKLDNDCEDAISELRKAKLLQIMEKGFTKEVAEESLSRHGSVAEALASLLSSGVSRIQVRDDLDIFISDDEIENIDKTPPKPKPKPPTPHLTPSATQSPYYDIKRDPKNPEGHNSIWIGNVQPDVTEKKLTTMFGKYGELISVKAIPEKFCAFVNYKSKASPGKAMQALQGYELSGYNLVIRFPNLPGETAAPAAPTAVKKKPGVIGQEVKKMGPVNGNECYFWRTTGCVYGEVCRYKHIKEHKGIDKKGWQVT